MDIKNSHKQYKSCKGLVYSCQYHVIFSPKYRRKVLTDNIANRAKELVLSKQDEFNFEIIEIEIMPDHIHMLIDINPNLKVCTVVAKIKGFLSFQLREEFPELKKKLPCLWTGSKFISSVGSVSLETVKKYIANQKTYLEQYPHLKKTPKTH